VRFIDKLSRYGAKTLAMLLAACSSSVPQREPEPIATAETSSPRAAQPSAAIETPRLEPARPARNWPEFRIQAARRMVAANPQLTYTGEVPDILLAIPVLTVELNADGSVRRIEVMRHPKQAKDTTQLAIDAVRRAAPYGDVSRLPKPWRFNETFLFDDERRFKPRSLD
jgi:hypothetical protein